MCALAVALSKVEREKGEGVRIVSHGGAGARSYGDDGANWKCFYPQITQMDTGFIERLPTFLKFSLLFLQQSLCDVGRPARSLYEDFDTSRVYHRDVSKHSLILSFPE